MEKKDLLRNKVLFLIDDDIDDQEIFKSALEEVDNTFILLTANNGYEALQVLSGDNINPDYIFVDLNMPKMDGLQFLKEVQTSGILKNIPVIIYTTSAHPSDISKTKELGALNFVTKPTRFADLRNLLKSLLIVPPLGK